MKIFDEGENKSEILLVMYRIKHFRDLIMYIITHLLASSSYYYD